MKSKSGFTLVELAVVIVLLAILATIATAQLLRVQAEQRDTSREAAVRLIMEALETYYDKNGEYPDSTTLNPTADMVGPLNYEPTLQLLPELSTNILTTEEYPFIPFACPGNNCLPYITNPDVIATRNKSILYISWVDSGVASLSLPPWGCTVSASGASTDAPAGILSWKKETTGQWIFVKTKRGQATIQNSGPGPTAPTTCTFTTLN